MTYDQRAKVLAAIERSKEARRAHQAAKARARFRAAFEKLDDATKAKLREDIKRIYFRAFDDAAAEMMNGYPNTRFGVIRCGF